MRRMKRNQYFVSDKPKKARHPMHRHTRAFLLFLSSLVPINLAVFGIAYVASVQHVTHLHHAIAATVISLAVCAILVAIVLIGRSLYRIDN